MSWQHADFQSLLNELTSRDPFTYGGVIRAAGRIPVIRAMRDVGFPCSLTPRRSHSVHGWRFHDDPGHCAKRGLCIPHEAEVLTDEFYSGGSLSRILLFTSAMITQMVQTAACNRHHTVDQQLCRWMLMSLDRLPSTRISMTEKLIGNMLGIDRAKVSEATGVLADAGQIHYNDGEITVLDRPGVERRSCECYGVVQKESERLLPFAVAKLNA